MTEVDEKVERVARCAREHGLAGVLISTQPNFAWLTAGQSNRIDSSVEAGQGSLLIGANGRRYVVANRIELPRLAQEALNGLGFDAIEYPWAEDHANPAAPLVAARGVVAGELGSDRSAPGARDISKQLVALQAPLTAPEIDRYRSLGREVASSLEQLCRSLRPGLSETAVAARVDSAVVALGARPVVTLVAADERIAAFRHPVPTARTWNHSLLVGLCAEREGLVVALSRIISARPSTLSNQTRATAQVFAALLAATRPGATGAQLFAAAAAAYEDVGSSGQEALHHQGGAIGYRSRDWIAHPASTDTVTNRQAFAWNPSITGTKVEDTALLIDGAIELITSTGTWPTIEVPADGTSVSASGILDV